MWEHRDVLPVLIYRRGRLYLRSQLREEAAGHPDEVRWISTLRLVANRRAVCYLKGRLIKMPYPFVLSKSHPFCSLRKASVRTCLAR